MNVKDDGSNEWLFESSPVRACPLRLADGTGKTPLCAAPIPQTARVPALDYRIFWWALYAAPLTFFALGLSALLSFSFSWMVRGWWLAAAPSPI